MLEDLRGVKVWFAPCSDLIRCKDDTLTDEVGQHVVDWDELNFPAESFKHVLLLSYKLLVTVRDTDVVKKLVYTWVGFLKILSTDEQAGQRDQSHDVVSGLALEMGERTQVFLNVRPQQVSVENVYWMVEGFWLHPQFLSKVKHPLHKHLSVRQIKGIRSELWVKSFCVFHQLNKNYVHWDFRAELLVILSDWFADAKGESVKLVWFPCDASRFQVSKVATESTVAQVWIVPVGQPVVCVHRVARRALVIQIF